jgi:hypothetical protein
MRDACTKSCLRPASCLTFLAFAATAIFYVVRPRTSLADSPTAPTAKSSPSKGVPVDGEPFIGKLKSVDSQWNCEFTTANGSRRIPASSVVQWGQWPDAADGPQVLLANGGRIITAEIVSLDRDEIQLDSDLLETIRLPRSVVAGIVFHPPTDCSLGDKLTDRIVADTDGADRVILANHDELSGTFKRLSKNTLEFESAAGPLRIDVSRVDALLFNPKLRSSAKPRELSAWLGFRDGSRILASAAVSAESKVNLSLFGGVNLTAPLDAIVALMPQGWQITYLSDLAASSYRHIPYFDLTWNYRNDRSVGGSPMRADGRLHLKGIGMHSASRITYDLDQPYRRFEAELAIDDETSGQGSIIGRVLVDPGDGKWQMRYESPTVRGGLQPVSVGIDVTGAKRISLLVDFADRGDQQDHADWLDARLVK